MQRHLTLLLLLSIVIGVIAAPVSAQTITYATDFTYQGYLEDGGTPVDATCDFTFALFDAESGGNPVGTVQTASAVSVSAGVFSAALDFGIAAFNGQDRWLEIAVNDCAGGGTFTTLTPRQRITPAPYALALYGLRTEPNTTSPNVIGGFVGNSVTSSVVGATVSGGGSIDEINRVTDNYGTVGGGTGNLVGDDNGNTGDRQYATVGGGQDNTASGDTATVGGGQDNTASGSYATVPGGRDNVASGSYATVPGGRYNVASGTNATVGGGQDNTASSGYTTVGGGRENEALAESSTIGGGVNNTASGNASFIGGGQGNTASGGNATVGGGSLHTASGSYTTVGGGVSNTASGDTATVGGGSRNVVIASYGTVGGGGGATLAEGNRVTDNYGTVGGGTGNLVGDDNGNTGDRQYATVGGGRDNVASGGYATVPGGRDNVASGGYAFAAGRLAVADDAGAFVWADSTDASFESSTANQFSVRAAGGVRLFSNSALTTGCTLPAGGSGWVCTSDRAAKEAFETVDPREVLAAVAALPVSTWNFIGTDTRHMGPVAQDFYAAFGLGEGDTGINSLDADGVALAAIQGLNLELGARDAQLAAQAAQLTALQVMLAVMLVTGAAGFIVMYRALAQMKRALNA